MYSVLPQKKKGHRPGTPPLKVIAIAQIHKFLEEK